MIGKASYAPGIMPLRELKWVDVKLAEIQAEYAPTLSTIHFPPPTQCSSHDRDYPVMVDGEHYGTVRETRCYSRLEYRVLMPDGDHAEPISSRVHDSPLSAVCELARRHDDQELADRLTDYIIEVSQVQEVAAIQLRKNTAILLGVGR